MISPKRVNPFSKSSTTGGIQTSSDLNFIDEKFEVIPAPAKIQQPGGDENQQDKAPGTGPEVALSAPSIPDYTEDDLLFMTEAMWSLPGLIWDKLPPRDPEKLKKWNNQFYRYCKKKGINPFEYFFDELPLAIATIGLGGSMYRDYKAIYGDKKDTQTKEDKKLSSDYEHEKQIAQQKEKDIKEGLITSSPGPEGVPA